MLAGGIALGGPLSAVVQLCLVEIPHQLHVERKVRQSDMWAKVDQKMEAFLQSAVLPEPACPCHQLVQTFMHTIGRRLE